MLTAKIAYFSGTGGARRIAECAASELEEHGWAIDLERIGSNPIHKDEFDQYDLLVLVSVVHEFNFPHQVRTWSSMLDQLKYAKAAVFSVSGGGRAVGNHGAQKKVIETLEKQGISVLFDETFVMPSNFFYRIKHPVDAMLMTAYPVMVKHSIAKLIAGEVRRPRTSLFDQLVTRCFRNSWKNTHRFGSAITVSNDCTACGICVRTCPVSNIELSPETSHPDFGDACAFCLACLYSCPTFALQPGRDKYALLKEGYDLREIQQRRYDRSEWNNIESLCKGYLYSGVKVYLLEARSLLFCDE